MGVCERLRTTFETKVAVQVAKGKEFRGPKKDNQSCNFPAIDTLNITILARFRI